MCAMRRGERKVKNILETGAEAVFSGNVGCLIQIGRYLREKRPGVWVAHPVDALWASYSGGNDCRRFKKTNRQDAKDAKKPRKN